MYYRYCQVPTFGRGTIRRFHTNTSAMKGLAARDFEDLLQVRLILSEFDIVIDVPSISSVLFQYLKDSSLPITTKLFSTSSLTLLCGTPMQNFACILTTLLHFLTRQLLSSVNQSTGFNALLVRIIIPQNFLMSMLPVDATRQY
jgi:hypothetical protein